MDNKRLTYVLAIVKEGRISAAAKKLYISQPALSQAIKAIEEEIGAPILRRDTSFISLTYEGELYVKMLMQMQELQDNFSRQISDFSQSRAGKITLGVSAMRAQQLLPQLLPALRRELPGLELRLVHGNNRKHLTQIVEEGQVDFAISGGPRPWGMKIEVLTRCNFIIIVSRNHPMSLKYGGEKDWRKKPEVTFHDFSDDCFILNFPGQGGRTNSDYLMNLEGFTPRSYIEVFDYSTLVRLADEGMGAAILSDNSVFAQYDRLNGCLFKLSTSFVSETFLFYRSTLYISGLMQKFIDMCKTVPIWRWPDLLDIK
ncbi:MAG: LysR family transcriptional regulator [Clostridiaceae bacterium]|nr:LysR family transcriptional regulator [Clostridiaceae bacterium]